MFRQYSFREDNLLPMTCCPTLRACALWWYRLTNAQVIIRQNGYRILSFVALGAFEITDMYPTGGAGDLDVTIKEADGGEQHFGVPLPLLPYYSVKAE